MTVKTIPVACTLIALGSTDLGQFTGLRFLSDEFDATDEGPTLLLRLRTSGADAGLGFYGDGSDGSLHFDGITTPDGTTLVGSVYLLHRDLYCTDILIDEGITVKVGGPDDGSFRILALGTLTNNGTISNDGDPGVDDAAGGAFPQGSIGANTAGGTGGSGDVGAPGGDATGTLTDTGVGGAGGSAGEGFEGGIAGTATPFPAGDGTLRSLPNAALGTVRNARASGGTGGGGGGSSDGTTPGGGGGAGGAPIVIVAVSIINNGTIRSAGGAGGNASGGGAAGAGGGGGGGGLIIIVARTEAENGAGVIVPGGLGGTSIDAGEAGSNGADGSVLRLTA